MEAFLFAIGKAQKVILSWSPLNLGYHTTRRRGFQFYIPFYFYFFTSIVPLN